MRTTLSSRRPDGKGVRPASYKGCTWIQGVNIMTLLRTIISLALALGVLSLVGLFLGADCMALTLIGLVALATLLAALIEDGGPPAHTLR